MADAWLRPLGLPCPRTATLSCQTLTSCLFVFTLSLLDQDLSQSVQSRFSQKQLTEKTWTSLAVIEGRKQASSSMLLHVIVLKSHIKYDAFSVKGLMSFMVLLRCSSPCWLLRN